MATLAAPIAHAQDAPGPSPSPSAGPVVVPPPRPQSLPGVIPERFSIAPAASPTPTPVPQPSPIPTVRATPTTEQAVPSPRPISTPRSTAPTPTPTATPIPAPLATSAPVAIETAVPQPGTAVAPVAEPADAIPPWAWIGAGAGGVALLGLGAWLLRRRQEEDEATVPEPEPVVAPPPPPLRVQPPPGLKPPEPAPMPAVHGAEPFELALNPRRLVYAENDVVLEFELLVGNRSGAAAENIRIAFAAMSAQARQDEMIAGFHAGPQGAPGGEPFDLAPDGGGRLPVRLAIPRSGVNVLQVNGRPMFVPIVLVDLRWRGGLSVRRFGADFMLGTAGQGGKLGPFWLDRPAPAGPLAANRYFARKMAAA